MANAEWSHASKFDISSRTPKENAYIQRVLRRLQFPLFKNRENKWADNMISFIFCQKLNCEVKFEDSFKGLLGISWRKIIRTERIKII